MARPRPSLAATLIVRNEARCIARCLDSVRPWVDRMVVLDTGSTDDTVALARAAGAVLHHLEWPDDFSVARNHVLDLADADWNLVIDADEWIMGSGAALREWTSGPPRPGALCIHSSFDLPHANSAALPCARSWIARLLPRGVRYKGRIHEQPVSSLPPGRVAVDIGHDGYRDAQAEGKKDRNQPLLLRMLKDAPDDPYTLYQLGKDAESRKAWADASDWYGRARALTAHDAPWLHSLTVRHLHCLGQTGAVEQALEHAGGQIERWCDSPDFFFVLGNLLMDRAMRDPAHAIGEWLPLAETMWERCLEIGERPDLDGSVAGRGSHLARHNLDVLRTQLESLRA